MKGTTVAGFIFAIALLAGAAMYYLQVYAYYEEVPATGTDDVQLTALASGVAEPILYENFQAIDADSSPIRYRACFTTPTSAQTLSETYQAYPGAEPLVAPGWFDCFDAKEVGYALEDGKAAAFMGEENFEYGIDRVVAILPDGRGFVWHQINRCGEVVFDGRPEPEGCPPKPEN